MVHEVCPASNVRSPSDSNLPSGSRRRSRNASPNMGASKTAEKRASSSYVAYRQEIKFRPGVVCTLSLGPKRILPGRVGADQLCAECAGSERFEGTRRGGWQAFRCVSSQRSGQVAIPVIVERQIADTASFNSETWRALADVCPLEAAPYQSPLVGNSPTSVSMRRAWSFASAARRTISGGLEGTT